MRSMFATLVSLSLPAGITSGQRIFLDGVNGVILVFDANNNIIASMAPNDDPGGKWVAGVTSYDYPAPGFGAYVTMVNDLIAFVAWNGRQAFVKDGIVQVDDSGLTAPIALTIRAPSDDPPNGHSASLELDSQYNNGVSIVPPVAIIYDNSGTTDVPLDLIVSGITYGRDRTKPQNGLFGTPVRESWHNFVIGGTWTQDPNSLPFSCRVDSQGFVRFRGGILAGTRTDGTVVGTVPAAFKPAKDILNSVCHNGIAGVSRIVIRSATGNIEVYDVSTAGGLTFDQVCYAHPDMQ